MQEGRLQVGRWRFGVRRCGLVQVEWRGWGDARPSRTDESRGRRKTKDEILGLSRERCLV